MHEWEIHSGTTLCTQSRNRHGWAIQVHSIAMTIVVIRAQFQLPHHPLPLQNCSSVLHTSHHFHNTIDPAEYTFVHSSEFTQYFSHYILYICDRPEQLLNFIEIMILEAYLTSSTNLLFYSGKHWGDLAQCFLHVFPISSINDPQSSLIIMLNIYDE